MAELELITNVLDEYQSNKLFSLNLRRDLIGQESSSTSFDTSQEIDDNEDRPENVKQMEVDGKLLRTLDYDLISYDSYLSAVKFNWVEAVAKEKFIASTILEEDGLNCSYEEIQRLNESNMEYENMLKASLEKIERDESKILEMAQELQDRYTEAQATYKLNRLLTNDIADLELELNELKMNQKEDDGELMTISEATEAAGGLERQLMEMTTKLSENNTLIPKLKAQYTKESKLVDQLRSERNAIEKAEGDRRRTLGARIRGGSIAKLESSRTWLTSVTQTYKASIGILSIDVSGPNPLRPTKLQVKFGLRHPLTGTLVIELADSPSLGTRMISSAYLDQSSQDISTIVEPSIRDNDLISLVISVRHFLARLQSSLPEN
ncbi:hypothetical protein H4Q26_005311 [Puccinia striiformis f. sp. tritici PST-130]|uniref:Kinetochore protein Sos7 coiled-coil domain-containing protein n=1 Tax=Puccinia striiformis f. sp. tritici PST-78 TaxID=1165861 RepID=A0A0L0VVT9_9BASI|nr:hypothetical protein Pst134EB_028547 [Puccinia striiformis f. sp. tritici]KAI9607862.1 hypothetical protein H4Q26_005311 [Puccinia striiformis f. sp. tritici PST-130]KNF03312.1 hypothetical protein PSTG_03580 [Puccinia striiformis f. sp. tritici PST-78]